MIIISLVGYVIFNHESNKILNYSIKEQLMDILPSFILASSMGIIVYFVGYFCTFDSVITLTIQILTGIVLVILSGELLKIKEYIFIKTTFFEKLNISRKSSRL